MSEHGYYTANYQKQGGARLVIGGTLQVTSGGTLAVAGAAEIASGGTLAVQSGGSLDVEASGSFKIDGTTVTPSAAELNVLDGTPQGATITVTPASTAHANDITLTVQLTDADGADLAARGHVITYLSLDANGDARPDVAVDKFEISGDGLMFPIGPASTSPTALLVSESDGDATILVSLAAAGTCYLAVCLPNGKLDVSGAMNFT